VHPLNVTLAESHLWPFSPDGSKGVSGSGGNTLCIWDVTTGAQTSAPLEGYSGRVYSVVFSPDGSKVISGSGDDTLCIWDVAKAAQTSVP
jgi:WD40 repeat protein